MPTLHPKKQEIDFFELLKYTMRKNAPNVYFLTVICILLCFSLNYTFPLHRESSVKFLNASKGQCDIPVHHETIAERTKKMATNIENVFKRFRESTQDLGKSIYEHVNSGLKMSFKQNLSEDDLRHYEQLVIMKKYPYLDLKDLELKYSPSNKHARQSIKYEPGSNPFGYDPSIWEPLEEGPNVEITNRGLSGFAIPNLMAKQEYPEQQQDQDKSQNSELKLTKKSVQNMLVSLKDQVEEYVENKT